MVYFSLDIMHFPFIIIFYCIMVDKIKKRQI